MKSCKHFTLVCPVVNECSRKGEEEHVLCIYLQDGSHEDGQASQNKHKGSSDSLFPETKSKIVNLIPVFIDLQKRPNQCWAKASTILLECTSDLKNIL